MIRTFKLFSAEKLFVLLVMAIAISCDDPWLLEPPSFSVSISPENPQVGDTVTFTVSSGADLYSIYTGDKYVDDDEIINHKYEESALSLIPEEAFEFVNIERFGRASCRERV